MESGSGGKGKDGGDHLPYSPPLASASNTTLTVIASVAVFRFNRRSQTETDQFRRLSHTHSIEKEDFA